MELEPEQPQPIYLHFKQQKFFEIQINPESTNKTISRCGALSKDGTEVFKSIQILEKPHKTQKDAEIYMNNVVDKKIAKGYEMMQRKIPVKQETKLETFSPITKESFFVKENPEQFLIIPELKSPEGTTPATRATQTVIVISDDEEIIEMPRNEIIYSKEKIREEVIDYDPIVAMLAEVEIFLNKPEPYKNFYLTRQIEENLEFCSLHIFKNTLVIEEGIEGVDKFPTVSRSFQNFLDAHLALKKIINDKLALNYQFNYDKLKEIQEQQMQEEEEQSDEDIFSKDPSIDEE